jgi:hypothetical protein
MYNYLNEKYVDPDNKEASINSLKMVHAMCQRLLLESQDGTDIQKLMGNITKAIEAIREM